MEEFNIYKDIAERTQGDIYVGVVGPVRTGKSTFIKRFMDLMVLPNVDNTYKKERLKDELPQSGSGKTIHTTEPKFIPSEGAVEINLEEGIKFNVRMVDCVGYIVKEALGYLEDGESKMVTTSWYEDEIPFEDAAELGTRKVITDHSTIGVMITTDGSITGIAREDYLDAEERVVAELKLINKPFIIVLNTNKPNHEDTKKLQAQMEEMYKVPVQIMDIAKMDTNDINTIFTKVLKEFNVKEINIDMPEWIEKLDPTHWLKSNFMNIVKDMCKNIFKIRDISECVSRYTGDEFLGFTEICEMNLGTGEARINMNPQKGIFYKIISEICENELKDESDLIALVKELHNSKIEYDKVAEAIKDVKETGYGLVAPQLSEIKFEKPDIDKIGEKYEIKLKASAPSLHMIKADIETEISPIMGTEKETQEVFKVLLEQFENDPDKLWQSNIFGKSLETLVKDGLQNKLYKMPEKIQVKMQKTLQKIINEGDGNLICFIY
ncbi:MAG: stage IV sporulation protein A [Sarcina sp.]